MATVLTRGGAGLSTVPMQDPENNSDEPLPAESQPAGAPPSPEQHAPLAEDSDAPRGPKVRKARDPNRRRLEAEAEATRRALRKALREKDERKLAALRELAVDDKRARKEDAPPAPSPVQLVPPPPPPSSRGPNWPSEASIDGMRTIIAPAVGVLVQVSQGKPWEIPSGAAVEFTVAGQTKRVTAQEALTDALSAVAAKYLPSELNSPEAYLGAVVATIWAGPVLERLMARAGLGAVTQPRAVASN